MLRSYKKIFSLNFKNCGLQNRCICQGIVNKLHVTNLNREVYDIKDEEDFKTRVMRSSVPVIVNFHADWCEPCHSLKPLLQKIVNDNPGKIHLAEILVDDHATLLQTFEVTAVPAVLAIHRGSVKDKFIGLVTDKQIKAFVENLLKDSNST
ncbi:Thioredoxin, mitochondrial [Armadillidium nasatum]|uniref:Thioredoxin, mitochondrial n=1 Tax=Armadillidium nasatum TaxID=96803 RepID=A0A5N5TKI5_9CRUS|nr:Thioredoxin, mitochondrial [Armadillidium nasatum]